MCERQNTEYHWVSAKKTCCGHRINIPQWTNVLHIEEQFYFLVFFNDICNTTLIIVLSLVSVNICEHVIFKCAPRVFRIDKNKIDYKL